MSAHPVAVPIAGEMTIWQAAGLKPVLLAAAADAAVLDLAAVSALDTAGVQLLLMAARSAAARGVQLRLAAASPAARSVIGLLGLQARLGLAPEPEALP